MVKLRTRSHRVPLNASGTIPYLFLIALLAAGRPLAASPHRRVRDAQHRPALRAGYQLWSIVFFWYDCVKYKFTARCKSALVICGGRFSYSLIDMMMLQRSIG